MTGTELPLLGAPPSERADAARNRQALLRAASRLVEEHGVGAVTMDAVAEAACVGKGTVFRRFQSRTGLMAALLNHREAEWQGQIISGPPPLGPGAEPLDRLLAFGRSRMELTMIHGDLLEAAGYAGSRSVAAYGFLKMHVRMLLAQLGIEGDLPMLSSMLLAPLEVNVLLRAVREEGVELDRIYAGWSDLVRRVAAA